MNLSRTEGNGKRHKNDANTSSWNMVNVLPEHMPHTSNSIHLLQNLNEPLLVEHCCPML